MSILQRKNLYNKLLTFFFLIIIVSIHGILLFKTFYVDSEGNMRAAAAGYGDIPFHMTQVSKFAYQNNINFNEPIFDGERLRYAFYINLISGMFLRFSGNWLFSMQTPIIGFMTTATILMFIIYRKILKSNLGAVAAVFLFLFGSGFGINYLIRNHMVGASRTVGDFFTYIISNNLSTITKWDAIFPDQNIGWGSPLSLVLLHQRAFIFGFFMFTLFLFIFQKWKNNSNNNLLTIVLGVIVGMTPLAHYHTFVVMMVVILFFSIRTIWLKDKHLFNRLIILGIIITIFSLPQIIYLMQGKNNLVLSSQSFIKFRLGWMTQPTTGSAKFNPEFGVFGGYIVPYLNFLWINFGIILPIFLLTIIFTFKSQVFRNHYPKLTSCIALAVFLFFLVQLVRFQPWDYDDNKILVYFQFFAAPVLIAFFIWLSKHAKLIGYISFAIFLFFATYSGIFDQIPRLVTPLKDLPIIFSNDLVKTADFIRNNVPYNDRVITSSTHLNIINSLSGRPVILGYPGWLWTRGIDYSAREENLRKYYLDPLKYQNIAQYYKAKYVLIDPVAVYDWKANVDQLAQISDLIFNHGQYQLYRLRQ